MKRSHSSFFLTCLALLFGNILPAQNVDYPKFTIPVYRYATDQRSGEHNKVFYATAIEDKPGESLSPLKSNNYSSK